MVGAYGIPAMNTPNLDRLAAAGVRFERAYTSCPLCGPARGGIFSGMHPPVMGAWTNDLRPHSGVPLMGEIFRSAGYRAAYTGKWHLDAGGYFGNGRAEGGFEEDWWFDGRNYLASIGPERAKRYMKIRTPEELRELGFDDERNIWAHGVADRAVDFLQRVGDEPFVLVASFDEPHDPFVAPPQWWEDFDAGAISQWPHYEGPLEGKPALQQVHREQTWHLEWDAFAEAKKVHWGCNSYVDRQIGRILDAVEDTHGDDTVVIYTSDHGDMMGAHGLHSKGPMMYDDIANIPLLVRDPRADGGSVSRSLVSHLDILPTMLELADVDASGRLHGRSFATALEDPAATVRDDAMITWHRYGLNHSQYGGFYPIRCLTDGRYKLAINLLDTDELYDMEQDPYEQHNRIGDPALAGVRNDLHSRLLDRMDEIRDPFRSHFWGRRSWNCIRRPLYKKGAVSGKKEGESGI
jgi:uncharacterized sulfatase